MRLTTSHRVGLTRQIACAVSMLALLATGCMPMSGPGQPGNGNGNDNSDLPMIELTEPPREPTTWETIADGIEEDGTIPKDVALKAFAFLLGDIPGVTPPADDDTSARCGSIALRWVNQYADELTDEERDAIEAALNPDGVGDGSARLAQGLFGDHGCVVGISAVSEDDEGTEPHRVILDQELAKLEQALGQPLGIPVYLTLGIGKSKSSVLAWTSPQTTGDCNTEPASSCRIELFTNRPDFSNETELRATISHELVHCYQSSWLPIIESMNKPDWLMEGFADYVGEQLNPTAKRTSFLVYAETPQKRLFVRTYDAQGFFFHLHSIGANVFGRYMDAFKKTTNSDVFAHLVQPYGPEFTDTWASSFALDQTRGDAWYMPEAPPEIANATPGLPIGTLDNSMIYVANVGEASTRIAHVDFDADVVRFDAGGDVHGRISWDDGGENLLSEVDGKAYCRLDGGCQCPQGTSGTGPSDPIPSVGGVISVAGTTGTTLLTLIGVPLADYCKGDSGPGPAPADGVDSCIVGNWVSDEWVLPGPISDLDGVGGDGALVTIQANGVAQWNFDQMQPVTNFNDVIDVTTEQYTQGNASGRISAANGVWTVSERNTSNLNGFAIDSVIGQFPLASGPGLFVGLSDGGYTCGGGILSYTTIDPVENAAISVTFHKQ